MTRRVNDGQVVKLRNAQVKEDLRKMAMVKRMTMGRLVEDMLYGDPSVSPKISAIDRVVIQRIAKAAISHDPTLIDDAFALIAAVS